MSAADLSAVLAIQAEAYAGAGFSPEPAAVYSDRMALAGELCLVVVDAVGSAAGYLVSHPWHAGAPPALHAQLGAVPADADCWYLHDCAVAARAHGQGVAGLLVRAAQQRAFALGLRRAALVAVGDAAGYWQRLGYVVQHRPDLADKLAGYGPGACYMLRELCHEPAPCAC